MQIKTWNLSSIWRIPTEEGTAWLKAVPPFFGHEALIIAALDAPFVPRLIGGERGRSLLAQIDGDDNFSATGRSLLEMMELLIQLQVAWLDRVPELLSLGLPDRRLGSIMPRFADVLDQHRSVLTADDERVLESLLNSMDARRVEIEGCGIPDTLVHGDFHPGNVKGHSRLV